LQGFCAFRGLRDAPEMAVCNHLATQIRAPEWERMGLGGTECDGRAGRRPVADVRFRRPSRWRLGSPVRAAQEAPASPSARTAVCNHSLQPKCSVVDGTERGFARTGWDRGESSEPTGKRARHRRSRLGCGQPGSGIVDRL